MLWVLTLGWALGAWLIVAAFLVVIAFRRTALAVAMFVVGAVLIGVAASTGRAVDNRVHGVRVDVVAR